MAGEVPVRIHGLSSRASLAVQRVELLSNDYYLSPGATGKALRRYWAFLYPAGSRPLYPQDAACRCRSCALDDVRHARDVLEQALGLLPSREGAELRRVVQQLDDLYRRRTLPIPLPTAGHGTPSTGGTAALPAAERRRLRRARSPL